MDRNIVDRIQEAILDLDSRQLIAEAQGYQNAEWRLWRPSEIAEAIGRHLYGLPASNVSYCGSCGKSGHYAGDRRHSCTGPDERPLDRFGVPLGDPE